MQINPVFVNGSINFLIGAGFCYCAFVIYSSLKRNFKLRDLYYAIFWLLGGIFNLSLIAPSFFQETRPGVSGIILGFVSLPAIGAHIVLAPLYLISRISLRKTTNIISVFLGALIFALFLIYFAPRINARGLLHDGISDQKALGYTGSLVLIAFMAICFLIVWKESKSGAISFKNLSSFYSLYAIIIYISVAIPYVLAVIPGKFFCLFYLTIPFLVYLSYGKKKSKN